MRSHGRRGINFPLPPSCVFSRGMRISTSWIRSQSGRVFNISLWTNKNDIQHHCSKCFKLILPKLHCRFLSIDSLPTRFLSQLKPRIQHDHHACSVRQLRVANSVHQALLECIFVEDLLFGILDRTRIELRRVEMSPDLRYAKVYWQSNDDDDSANTKVSSSEEMIPSFLFLLI